MTGASIVITGIGPVTPVGLGRAELAAALAEGLEPVEIGEINLDDYLASGKTYLDPNSVLALCSVALALDDAQLAVTDETAPLVGISLGTRLGNAATIESYLKMLREQGVKLASPLLFIHAYPNASVSLSAMEFALKGTSFNFNSGRWCGLQALIQSVDELRCGKMSVMLAVSADTNTDVTRRAALGTPFDAAAALVAEPLGAARARGVRPLVEVAGCGIAGAIDDALERALADAALDRTEIDWLLADGSGAVPTDAADVHAANLVNVVGDCGAATAMTGVLIAALAMGKGVLPAGLGPAELPRTAVVTSADGTGAAAAVLRTPAQ